MSWREQHPSDYGPNRKMWDQMRAFRPRITSLTVPEWIASFVSVSHRSRSKADPVRICHDLLLKFAFHIA